MTAIGPPRRTRPIARALGDFSSQLFMFFGQDFRSVPQRFRGYLEAPIAQPLGAPRALSRFGTSGRRCPNALAKPRSCSACPAGAPPSVRNARLGFHGGAKCCARDYQGEDSGHPFCFARTVGTPGCCEGATAAPTFFSPHKRANAAAMLKRCFTRSVLREGPRKAGGNSGTGAHQEPYALIRHLHIAQGE